MYEIIDNAVISVVKMPQYDIVLMVLKNKDVTIKNVVPLSEVIKTAYGILQHRFNKRDFDIVLSGYAINYFDSTALGALINAYAKQCRVGKRLVVCELKERIRRQLQALGLIDYIKIFDRFEDAVHYLITGDEFGKQATQEGKN